MPSCGSPHGVTERKEPDRRVGLVQCFRYLTLRASVPL